jgi:hypothetical protein
VPCGVGDGGCVGVRVRLLLLVGVFVVVLGFGSGRALGRVAYPLLGEVRGPVPGVSFVDLSPGGVAVDGANGHVLVGDSGVGLVFDFSSVSSVTPVVWDGSLTPAGSFGGGFVSVAVDDASGAVYVADTTHAVIDKFDASGVLVTSFGDSSPSPNGQLAGVTSPAGSFSHPNTSPLAIAVDQATHDLYVVDSGHQVVDVFSSEGVFLPGKQITATPFGLYGCEGRNTAGIAVDAGSGHVFVSDSCPVQTFEFDASGGVVKAWDGSAGVNPPGTPAGSFGNGYTAVAVSDVTNNVYIEDSEHEVVDQFAAGGEYLDQLEGGPGTPRGGVEVDQSTGHLLVADDARGPGVRVYGGSRVVLPDVSTGAVSELQASSVRLNGVVNPAGVTVENCRFEYVNDANFDGRLFDPYGAGVSVPCVETVGAGTEPVSVHADVSGLTVGTTYHFRLVAENANGPTFGASELFAALPPTVSGEAAEHVAASPAGVVSADLIAAINPQGIDTTYRFEYGSSGSYGLRVPAVDVNIGVGTSNVAVAQHVSELHTDMTYHWRVVAVNAAGTTVGVDHTFVYSTGGRGPLPDGRAYEMVTPARKNGALIGSVFLGFNPGVAEDGSRVVLTTLQCFEEGSCTADRNEIGASYAFTRDAGGWRASSLGPPAGEFSENSAWTLSTSDGSGVFSVPTGTGGNDEFYVRGAAGGFAKLGPVTSPALGAAGAVGDSALVKHATGDVSHFVYEESSGRWWPFDESSGETAYEYAGGAAAPVLVGVSGVRGSTDLISSCGTSLGNPGSTTGSADESLSMDGRLVYFTALRCGSGSGVNAGVAISANELFARVGGSESVLVSERSGSDCGGECANSPAGDASFQGASADGMRAFFLDTQQLTNGGSEDPQPGDTAEECSVTVGVNGCNLYMYDFGRPAGRLVAVSAGAVSGGPRVQGVVAVARSGARVYFVAKGVLSPLGNSQGELARDGADNLYVYERDEAHPAGVLRFVAILSGTHFGQVVSDSYQWVRGPTVANVSGDGRFLVFTSQRPLTGDDVRVDGGAAQVFRYDAVSGALVRVSVGDLGFNDNGNGGVGDAAIVPGAAFQSFAGSGTRNPSMSDDGGAVFFMSPVGLTPQALNDVSVGVGPVGGVSYAENVYEYRDGRVYLISDGQDAGVEPVTAGGCAERSVSDVCLVGVSGSGRDVFFTTSDQLVAGDTDTQLDYYDARVCSVGDPCLSGPGVSVLPCESEACRGVAGAAPGVAVGGSTAAGVGNQGRLLSFPRRVARCKRGFVRKHGRCVKVKHKHKRKHAPAKKARSKQRSGRAGRGGVRG